MIDYVLMRRNLALSHVQVGPDGSISFDVEGQWPIGVMDSHLTLRISGSNFRDTPRVEQEFHVTAGGYTLHNQVESIVPDGSDWLITMQLAPHRTVRIAR